MRIAKKELGVSPRELLHADARRQALRRMWDPSQGKIVAKDDKGRHVNFYQLWKQHPALFVTGVVLIGGLMVLRLVRPI